MIERTSYGLRVGVPVPYDRALALAADALKAQGFGVLTSIDMRETFRQKLDREFRRYTILGACNPQLASRAFDADIDVGLLLPCNVVVYETSPDTSLVAAMAPMAALSVVGENPALHAVAEEAERRLSAALDALAASAAGEAVR